MTRPRFFVDSPLAAPALFDLPDDVAHHALRVLRLADGDPITLFNGLGGEYAARLAVGGKRASARIETFDPVERESPLAVTLIQAWVATEKLDWIVEKAVELGAASIVLAPAERSVTRLSGERRARRLEHLLQLARAACAQCGRNRVPTLAAGDSLAAALALAGEAPLLALLPQAARPFSATVAELRSVRLAVGPEGGFSDTEVVQLSAAGAHAVRLGPRVLRTETAGLAALAALAALRGDFRDSAPLA